MKRNSHVCLAVLLLASLTALAPAQDDRPRRPGDGDQITEAWNRLLLNPHDPYLQYVVLTRAGRSGKRNKFAAQIERLLRRRGGRRSVDLLDLFTGALAVQESLQLDEMRSATAIRGDTTVPMTDLKGPTLRGHPWQEMLAGKKPEVTRLAGCVPHDQYLIEFRSLNKLVNMLEQADVWGMHFLQQAKQAAHAPETSRRLKTQLAIKTSAINRLFYDTVVSGVALTGTDLFVHEGSDVALLFTLKQADLFKKKMDGYLDDAAKVPGAVRRRGAFLGVPFEHVATADRGVHVYSAYPSPDLHVRANSRIGFERILRTIRPAQDPKQPPLASLANSLEYQYIRTLMPVGAEEEDGLVYLSDPFIRHMVGPQLKLTERRRILCHNRLRMIGHASLLHFGEQGVRPASIRDLQAQGYLKKGMRCECGGRYALAADKRTGHCTHHGAPNQLVPCCEVPLAKVTDEEAEVYRRFLANYNEYWRTYFDPIALRIKVESKRYRVETIVLPLIDNSIYRSLSGMVGGPPADLQTLPVPKRTLFSVGFKLERNEFFGRWLKEMDREVSGLLGTGGTRDVVNNGLGEQVSIHIYDTEPMFELNMPQLFGEMVGSFRGGPARQEFGWMLAIASLTAPVYAAIDVKDAKMVDAFLNELDGVLARSARGQMDQGWFQTSMDFYVIPSEGPAPKIRGYTIGFGPMKLRFFWARIRGGLYIASKKAVLDDLVLLSAQPPAKASAAPTKSHATLKLRARNWDRVLKDYRLGWAENQRQACAHNLGTLTSLARTLRKADGKATMKDVHRCAAEIYGERFRCPDAGAYSITEDGKNVGCQHHGLQLEPRQLAGPSKDTQAGRQIEKFGGVTAAVTLTEEGLRAVMTIEYDREKN